MSGYSRNYVGTWNKPGSYSSASKKEIPSTIPKYDSGYSRASSTKTDVDKTPKITTTKYGSYSSSYQPSGTSTGSYSSSRLKPMLDKRDTSHPPVSYKPLTTRTSTSRSRDPSPIERSEKSSSSSSGIYNPNRLYPRPYTRSNSRERTVSPTPSTSNLPKYTGRSSISSERSYGGRSSITKDDIPRYTGRSSSSLSKEDKYKTSTSRTASKEDLSGSQKYINSRFLPKNSVEKSYTAYTRPSLIRTHETSRKNKELLTILHAQQEQEKLSRPSSRCSTSHDEAVSKEVTKKEQSPKKEIEMETLTVITRGTSPSPTSQPTTFLRSRRIAVAKVVEKQITRPKRRDEIMIDKEVQSDRLDDSTRSSRFAGASRISATPWSSFLDMKFNSPNNKQQKENSEEKSSGNISRTSSSKSISSNKSDKSKKSSKPSKISQPKQLPPQIPKSESKSNSLHSLNTPNKDFRKSVLNMNPEGTKKKVPGRRSTSGSSAESDAADPDATDISENLATCKSFHKTNSSSKLPQKVSPEKASRNTRSPSSDVSVSSSASSEDDIKTKKQSLKSAGSSRTSMILSSADELSTDKSPKPPQSPRQKSESSKSEQEAKSFLMRALAPVTNLFKNKQGPPSPENTNKVTWILNSSDSPSEGSTNPPQVISEPRQAKIILHRVEAGEKPRILKEVDSGEIPWWLQKNPEVPEGVQTYSDEKSNSNIENSEEKEVEKSKIRPIQSGEAAWWLQPNVPVPEGVKTYPDWVPEENSEQKLKMKHTESGGEVRWQQSNSEAPKGVNTYPGWVPQEEKNEKPQIIKHVESGEGPWWLDDSAEVPEGVQTYPNWVREDGTTEDGRVIYKTRKNESDDSSWWNTSSSEKTDSKNIKTNNIMDQEYQERHKLRHIDSGERSWWVSSHENIPGMVEASEVKENTAKYAIRHQDSGSRPWWINSDSRHQEDSFEQDGIPLGDRASPEGLEMPKDDETRPLSPYDNVPSSRKPQRPNSLNFYISKHKNIDEILGGGSIWSPLIERLFSYNGEGYTQVDPTEVIIHEGQQASKFLNDVDPFACAGAPWPDPARPPLHTFSATLPLVEQLASVHRLLAAPHRLDDAALQLYKDGDYGSYLDLEASISEQQEEFEGFQSNKKNSIVLRTQLSVRVHTIIEKLLTSEGRELRRALFSLKQIFQEDKDLVHEFVQNDGLSCLIKVGSEADQNYQNYILRALGQVMLYVDGMNGVMEHNQTIQWLYTLISSKFRLVVKTALKLLLVFVEYTDSNCMLLIKAIHSVDYSQGLHPYHNIMKLLKDFDAADTELLIYATTLVNKVLSGVPDQDTYYDQVDVLEEQGIEAVIQRYMSKPGTDLDLLQQFQIYEAVLQYEDGEDLNNPIRHLDESMRKTLRNRKSLNDTADRRKSRRHSTGTAPHYVTNGRITNCLLQTNQEDFNESSSSGVSNSQLNGSYKDSNKASEAGVTPALKRRRERAERQRSFMKEQQESASLIKAATVQTKNEDNLENNNGSYTNGIQQRIANGGILNRNSSRKDLTSLMNTVNTLNSEENLKQPWIYSQNIEESENNNENERNLLIQLKRENTVKDLTQKLSNQNILHSPSEENKINRIGDMSGLISKAKEGLAKSKSRADIKSPTGDSSAQKIEVKKSENELKWEELVANLNRSLNLCDMDFTDLGSDDERDVLAPAAVANGVPPPPPPLLQAPPPPPIGNRAPPPVPPTAPIFGINLQRANKQSESKIPMKKNKKTVKLFWKEVRDDPISMSKLKTGSIWDELSPVVVDTQKLEHLFESRAKDLITKKQQEMNKNKEIIVLDPKRSNAINIGMTKLPPPRSIKTAILKMDATVMNREGIEKLLTMLPTEEERTKIQEAQAANPDLPLGSAEQFLLTLASISELPARLKLWAFKLDFENSEREIAEPLMDLKQGFEVLKINKTFRGILSTLLSIGNFLNGNEVKGFQIEYLSKVPEVKDTVHKHSLLHHLCHIVMEKFPEATDLYSEIGAITRASKIDFDELTLNIQKLESDCKSSWDHLKLIAKHDGSTMMKVKMSDFLADCAERIILLGIIHRRIMNRFHKFLLWLGIPLHQIGDTKPNEFCRVVSEFALEYRTTRERVIQQLEKKANHRERNKTRGKMITDMGKFKSKEDRADAELRQLLGSDMSDVESLQGTLPWRRTRKDGQRGSIFAGNGNLTDGDDEILESLVKTATKGVNSRTAPRERKRTRHADRKSLRRTLKNGLSEEEKKHLSTYIKGY